MVKIDYNKMQNSVLSSNLIANDSDICWREFLLEMHYFTNHCGSKLFEEEIADLTSSLSNWSFRSRNTEYKEKINGQLTNVTLRVGDICLADLGLNYKPECAYLHPVLIVEKVHNCLVVIPTSTNLDKINNAYDFNANTGKWYYVKVGNSVGFDSDCVLMLDNLKTISQGRIVARKNFINEDINNENSLFRKVKNLLLANYFPLKYKEMEKLIKCNEELINENSELQKKLDEALEKIKNFEEAQAAT